MTLSQTDPDPADEPDAADALLLDAPVHLADAAAHCRRTGNITLRNSGV